MTYTATLNSINQEFVVHDNETILEAALRTGISLNYGCSGGTCGLCQAKLLSGKIVEIRPHEFVMPEADKLQGNFLACACTLEEDSVIDAITAENAHDIPVQEIEVKVRKVEKIAKDVNKIIIQTPRTKRLRFLAGQYIKLIISDTEACEFSIASCPCEDRLIELHVRSGREEISQRIAGHLRTGDTLNIVGPYGGFVFDEQAERPVILFAFDTGFAAIKSLLEHITAQEEETSIHLIWMSCNNDGLYMNNLCRSWTDAFDHFRYTGIVLNQALSELASKPSTSIELMESQMKKVIGVYDDLSAFDVYASAPLPVIKLFKEICIGNNLLLGRFFEEPARGYEDVSCIVGFENN